MSPLLSRWLLGWSVLLALAGGARRGVGQPLPQILRFGSATERQGLPGRTVKCLLRDHEGFLWAGTDDGLARYDGTGFQVWRHRPGDAHSLVFDEILSLSEDSAGCIWIGTHGGVCRLNAARDDFRCWTHHPRDPLSIGDDYDNRLIAPHGGPVWLTNGQGLRRYDARRDGWVRCRLPAEDLPESRYQDRAGRLWIGQSGWVRALDPRTGRVVQELRVPCVAGASGPAIISMLEDHLGNFWVGTWGNGLIRLDRATGRTEVMHWESAKPIWTARNIVFSLAETRNAAGRYTLWVGVSAGLLRLDEPTSGQPYPATLDHAPLYQHQAIDPATLTDGDVRSLLTDPAGLLWIGTATGLSWLVPAQQALQPLRLGTDQMPSYRVQQLIPIQDSRTGARQYWRVVSSGDGLSLCDSLFRPLRTWRHLPPDEPNFLASQMVDGLLSRVDGRLWIATEYGLVCLDPSTGSCRSYRGVAGDTSSPGTASISRVFEDRAGRLWVGTWRRGLFWLQDRERGVFQRFRPRGAGSLPFDLVTAIAEDRAGRLWVGGEGGVVYAEPSRVGSFRAYRSDPSDPHSLPHYRVSAICPQADGTVWVGTEGGVAIWQPRTHDFRPLTSRQGLPADVIYSITPDRAGRVWLTSRRGLIRAESATGPFRLFDTRTGLPTNDLACHLFPLPDGRLLLGLEGEQLLLRPDALRPDRYPPPVVLTEVRLFDQPLGLGRPLDQIACLELTPTQNTLTFGFAALSYADAARTRYFYRLDGAPGGWVAADARRYASYASLPGGEYTFRVRAINADGTPSVRDAKLRFRVRTPFARTPLFWGALVLLAGVLVVGRVRSIRRVAERQSQFSRELAELEMKALRAQMNPHFVFNALNAIQECVLTGRPLVAARYLARFARLLRLVLANSERGLVLLDTEMETLDLYLELEQLRLAGLQLNVWVDPELIEDPPRIPTMVLQPYLENALWHGLAARPPDQRRLRLQLAYAADKATVHATIEDSGIGRIAAQVQRPAHLWYTSMGMRLTERRLELLRASEGRASAVRVTDLTDPATGAAAGTRVELWLG